MRLGIVERCSHRLRSGATLLFLLAGAFVVAACQADVDVNVTVNEDGSGIVETETTLDEEASAALLDLETDADGLPLSDLLRSGWNVSPPERADDGSTVVTASKEFGNTAQFAEVMEEITGEDGVFRNFRSGSNQDLRQGWVSGLRHARHQRRARLLQRPGTRSCVGPVGW